jgi:hypothetical protein
MVDERTLRQRLVAEIGEQGQARIARCDAFARSAIERRYLEFAGFRSIGEAVLPPSRMEFELVEKALAGSDPNVVELATSAARALVQIKKGAGV